MFLSNADVGGRPWGGDGVAGRLVLWVWMLACVMLPLSSKVAGVMWLGWLSGALLTLGMSRGPAVDPAPLSRAALAWLGGTMAATSLWAFMAWWWQAPCCGLSNDLDAGMRLMLAAWAVWWLVRHPALGNGLRGLGGRFNTLDASVLALLVALTLVLMRGRNDLPVHPIPWAVGVAMLVCWLTPACLDVRWSRVRRLVYAVGVLAGLVAVWASQSRGAFAVLLWPAMLGAWGWACRGHLRGMLAVLTLALAGVGALAVAPGDPLRLQLAATEVKQAWAGGGYNTSLGARVYLYRMAWEGVLESPLTGVGPAQRLRLIREAGLDRPDEERAHLQHVRELGHVHNQYLHHALDGGLPALAGFGALLLGLAWGAWCLRREHPLVSRQWAGVWWVTATAALSNVNLAHNFHVLTLALGVGVPLLMAWAGGPLGDERGRTKHSTGVLTS